VDADSVSAWAAAAAVVVSIGAAATSAWSEQRRRKFEAEQEGARQKFEAGMAAAQHEFDVDLEREKLAMGRRMDAEALARYRDPLARAAEDLRSRLWNVRRGQFLQTYGVGGDAGAREARLSTLFRIAQYFAWSEILRREVQYLSFPDAEQTRSVM